MKGKTLALLLCMSVTAVNLTAVGAFGEEVQYYTDDAAAAQAQGAADSSVSGELIMDNTMEEIIGDSTGSAFDQELAEIDGEVIEAEPVFTLPATTEEEKVYIETTLNLANRTADEEWTYDASADAWILSVMTAVVYPELPDNQGVSVCVPGGYVMGIDTNADYAEDVTAQNYQSPVCGSLVINYNNEIVSSNGQIYTALTAPVILNTGAAGYSAQENRTAGTEYASEGYINVTCGNRGKQSIFEEEDGSSYYTGDAPYCLVDQKNAARFVKYNMLLGNLPGSVDYFVSTGGSGGGAHAAMFAATSDNPDFYDYEIEAGAVGVYRNEDGTYAKDVLINGMIYQISDGAWGSVAYSAITSLYEADAALAFEYNLDSTYEFNTPFQAQLAEYLSAEYMNEINGRGYTADESVVGFDLDEDGDTEGIVPLTIEYDPENHPETNGYYGTYLNFYLAEFTQNLQWYLDNLDYADDWTWFDGEGNALGNRAVAGMTTQDKALAFLEGRYAKGSSTMGGPGNMGGGPDGAAGGPGNMEGGPDGAAGGPGNMEGGPDGAAGGPGNREGGPDGAPDGMMGGPGGMQEVGTPDAGTTQAAGSGVDSSNYASFEEMAAAYEEDILEIQAGDYYKKNIVDLYNPLNYIGREDTKAPVWTRIVMGASEGDMSLLASMNLQLAWLAAGTDSVIEWQWDGGHVPSEIFGNSLSLYVDQMYGKYVAGTFTVERAAAVAATKNGSAEEPTGTDISSWVAHDDLSNVSFSLADIAAYRTRGASKAIPGFDVMDYGQEDYEFGSMEKDARHWSTFVLQAFQEHADTLSGLFTSGGGSTSAEGSSRQTEAAAEQTANAQTSQGQTTITQTTQGQTTVTQTTDSQVTVSQTTGELTGEGLLIDDQPAVGFDS